MSEFHTINSSTHQPITLLPHNPVYTEKTGVSNFECQNVESQSELLVSTTLFPKFFLFGQGDTHLIFCLTVTRVSESL